MLISYDPRHIAVSQRAYVEGVSDESGDAAFFFDRDLFPGYGWMFPMSGGTANVGVGILAETRDRSGVSVPNLFRDFIHKLRETHPGCRDVELVDKPLGGIVKTYGGAGPNYFDRGVLIGDAGCFVDPMTGEGITPAAESALIASSTIRNGLEQNRLDADFLSGYEKAFRSYFDPAMCYLDLCAAILRNRHMRDFWLRAVERGCRKAVDDERFARIAGSPFGGLDLQSGSILAQLWLWLAEEMMSGGSQAFLDLLHGRIDWLRTLAGDVGAWHMGWWQSVIDDPLWHGRWTADVAGKWRKVLGNLTLEGDPRWNSPLEELATR